MFYKCRLNFQPSQTNAPKIKSPPRVHKTRWMAFNPRFSLVFTRAVVSSCCRVCCCKLVLPVCSLFTCLAASRCRSVVCSVVLACRPVSVLRFTRVISRFNGGVPVFASVGLPVSYSRTVVTISSSFTRSVVVSVFSLSCRVSVIDVVAKLSVLASRSSVVCRSVLLPVCCLATVVFLVVEQLPGNRATVRIRTSGYLFNSFAKFINICP